jgi:hypothetical protein
MDWLEAQAQLTRLREQWQGGQISAPEFAAEVNRLRVQDDAGVWWQPDPGGQGWLRWDGTQWQPGVPPHLEAAPPETSRPAEGPAPGAAAAAAPDFRAGWRQFRSRLMAPQSFLETSRRLPLGQRPQSWWDALSIAGGAASGYLWFVYSSVRGMPRLQALAMGRESWFDLLPSLFLLAIPVLLVIFRGKVANAAQPWGSRLSGMSAGTKLALGAAALILLALVNTNNPLLRQREGLDFITPLLMTAIPALLVWFRAPTDRILAPIQAWRRKIPAMVLVGVSLAIPFLTAYVFYSWLGINQYPLLRLNLVVGTLLSYALVRNPNPAPGSRTGMPGAAMLALALLGVYLLLPELAWADDFLRDPFNLRDGLRTNGIAPVLAGVSTVMVSILVNGVEVVKVMVQDTKKAEDGKEEHKKFVVIVNSVDKKGATSTTLDQVNNDTIFIYAHCEEVGKGRFRPGDPTIKFTLVSAQKWVSLTDKGTVHDRRCAAATLVSPAPDGSPPNTADVEVTAGVDDLVSATLTLTLATGYVLEVF